MNLCQALGIVARPELAHCGWREWRQTNTWTAKSHDSFLRVGAGLLQEFGLPDPRLHRLANRRSSRSLGRVCTAPAPRDSPCGRVRLHNRSRATSPTERVSRTRMNGSTAAATTAASDYPVLRRFGDPTVRTCFHQVRLQRNFTISVFPKVTGE